MSKIMKILLLAPHPFYTERGTPIAIDLLLRSLSAAGHQVDLITFNEGIDRTYPGVTIHRVNPVGNVTNVSPGFSIKKLYLDFYVFFRFISLFLRRKYDVVHAVEESVYMAMCVCPLRRTPYIYDMDSSMVTQLLDGHRSLRFFEKPLRFIESLPARFADIVVPCCEALAEDTSKYREKRNKPIYVLKDISLLDKSSTTPSSGIDIANLTNSGNSAPIETDARKKVVMYIGNLESYQGIDLMLNGFAQACERLPELALVVVGGEQEHIDAYEHAATELGISSSVYFLGKQPVSDLYALMVQSDVLLSPRTQGVNTPMKVYSYLDSGVPVVATKLPTHTQVMTDDISCLVEANPGGISNGIVTLVTNPEETALMVERAREFIVANHSFAAFDNRVNEIYAALPRAAQTS